MNTNLDANHYNGTTFHKQHLLLHRLLCFGIYLVNECHNFTFLDDRVYMKHSFVTSSKYSLEEDKR